ncbi:MAG: hypothetical protein HYU66_21770 [Armatimonadetes bacterium]|nr:hypothetical protein [Armatimonadota bacterium]
MVNPHDRAILRDLARRVADIAHLPEMIARIREWRRHNRLRPGRPLILVFPEGSWAELLTGDMLTCEEDHARRLEWDLRSRMYTFEHFQTDNVVVGEWLVGKAVGSTGWGLAAQHKPSTAARGAWAFDPVINEPADLKKLHFPEVTYDEAAGPRAVEQYEELFGDILNVRLVGIQHISFHLMNLYTGWRGLQQVLMDMYAEPQMLHDAMAFLEEGHRRLVQQYVDLNLLELNNDNTYHNSGGNGWTDELPPPGHDPRRVRLCDMWGSAEAQEMSEVSPEQHHEFSMQYEMRLLEPFGLTGYGCCENLSRKLDDVLRIPHIRRISMSPFAGVDRGAAGLGSRAIFSWKPHPSHLVGRFDAERLRRYIQHTVDVCAEHGCVLEMILKDTHTCEHHPERFDAWTQVARAVVEECGAPA